MHCYFCYRGAEHSRDQFDVMTGSGLRWVDGKGKIPAGAICIGQEAGKQMFIGRSTPTSVGEQGEYLGKVVAYDDQNFKIYTPWKGKEFVNNLINHKILCQ